MLAWLATRTQSPVKGSWYHLTHKQLKLSPLNVLFSSLLIMSRKMDEPTGIHVYELFCKRKGVSYV